MLEEAPTPFTLELLVKLPCQNMSLGKFFGAGRGRNPRLGWQAFSGFPRGQAVSRPWKEHDFGGLAWQTTPANPRKCYSSCHLARNLCLKQNSRVLEKTSFHMHLCVIINEPWDGSHKHLILLQLHKTHPQDGQFFSLYLASVSSVVYWETETGWFSGPFWFSILASQCRFQEGRILFLLQFPHTWVWAQGWAWKYWVMGCWLNIPASLWIAVWRSASWLSLRWLGRRQVFLG